MLAKKITLLTTLFVALSVGVSAGIVGSNGEERKSGEEQVTEEFATGQVTSSGLQVTFHYPRDWILSHNEDSSKCKLYSPNALIAITRGDRVTPPDITVTLLHNSLGLSLLDFVKMYQDGWFTTYAESTPTSIDDHEALFVSDVLNEIPHIPTLGAFISLHDMVVLVTGHEHTQQQFADLVASLKLSELRSPRSRSIWLDQEALRPSNR